MNRLLATPLLAVVLLIAGCASLPENFDSEVPPLSKTDTNIVIACATIRQDMPEVQLGIETATPLALTATCKQPATLIRVGGFVYIIGTGLQVVGGQQDVPPTIVMDSASHLNTSISDAALLQQILAAGDSAFKSVHAQLTAMANSATNPDVKAYVLETGVIGCGGVGQALCYSTSQYAPTPASTAAAVAYLERVRRHARTVLAYAKHDPADLHRVMVAYLRD
jgi:hypothetical protein